MVLVLLVLIAALIAPAVPAASQGITPAATQSPSDVTLFRIFLLDGADVVSYGEYARVGDEVVASLPLGGGASPPLQLVTLPAASVDWPKTDRYAASAKFQRYIATRAEDDFAAMSAQVAAMLNEIALSTEPSRALAIAEEARRLLVGWPAAHFGYREADVREIAGIIDEAIGSLTPGASGNAFQLALVAAPPPVQVELLLGMPSPREQAGRLMSLSEIVDRAADRANLLRAALAILDDPHSGTDPREAAELRRLADARLNAERAIDRRYAELVERVMTAADRAAASARVSAVERLFGDVEREDARLGTTRPATVQALRAALDARLKDARELRLRRTEWMQRRDVYRDYVERARAQIVQLVDARETLDAIRRMAGLSPRRVRILKKRLSGGVEGLQTMAAPDRLRDAQELLVAAWGFAETAAERRRQSVVVDDGEPLVREASSAAAGALMLLARAQEEMRSALELPQLR